MGLWGDLKNPDFMGWLDKPPYGPCPVYSNPNPWVTYGNIKYGPIGSTAWFWINFFNRLILDKLLPLFIEIFMTFKNMYEVKVLMSVAYS